MLRITDFIDIYAERMQISKAKARIICKTVLETLGQVIYNDKEDICINGLGTFKHKRFAERPMRLPNGSEVLVPERDIVRFKQSEAKHDE